MNTLHWKLRDFLAKRKITRLELERRSDVNRVTLYRMTSPDPQKSQQRIDFPTLTSILAALREITGEDVTPNDLLEFGPSPKPNGQPLDEETRALMEADLGNLGRHETYEWGPAGEPEGRPVTYEQGQGLMIEMNDADA